ncbi:hypothetical protein [Ekhidna sp.]
MNELKEDQIENWLKKLERESWQLELLVSAFTIFLLLGANSEFGSFLIDIQYKYNLEGTISIVFIFLVIIKKCILALTICLVIHLMLRGFWIGAIGLRSVQSSIDFDKLNYNEFFTEKLRAKVVSLDRLVIMLDEICSVIFAFSFLIISIMIAFGLYLTSLAVIGLVLSTFISAMPTGVVTGIITLIAGISVTIFILFGLIYMIDYFTLGFFKKIRWFAKVYYPFYRIYNFITLSNLSRSIYYYLISKFSKTRFRIVYLLVGVSVGSMAMFSFDQYQYFPSSTDADVISSNFYDDQRSKDEYVNSVSLKSSFIEKPHFQIFLRYDPADNGRISSQCPDFDPIKDDGLNWKLGLKAEGGNFQITGIDYSEENQEKLLECQKSIYEINVNDSIYSSLKYHFFVHPAKDQKGILVTIPTEGFNIGENLLSIKKISRDSTIGFRDFVKIPFWYNPD